MHVISFMSANWVARRTGYHMTGGWQEGDRATNAYFQPVTSFRQRFTDLLREVRRLGFTAMDLWTGHLNWEWATDEHLQAVRDLAAEHDVRLASYAGGFGKTAQEFRSACDVAAALNIPLLGGGSDFLFQDKREFSVILKDLRLKFGIENHPEKTPEEVLTKIDGADEELVGACVDTGWFGTHGYDAAKALHVLRNRLFYVHLKDVTRPGEHQTCAFGAGCVPIESCVKELLEMKYLGGISIEHEPEDRDPAEECMDSRRKLEGWLTER